MIGVASAAHRPWPLPKRPWIMAMQWHDLLFMHWPVDPALLRPHIPAGIELDLFDGVAWLGVVPFRMGGVGPRFVPALPWVSAFAELNLRTYVRVGGKSGVWFFSLDAANPLAVRVARRLFHLPYYDAQMATSNLADTVAYSSRRTHRGAPVAAFEASYAPSGPVYLATLGSRDHWLTERYCLYGADRRGRIWRGDIHHEPWPLQPATANVVVNSIAQPIGVTLPNSAPLLHFVRRLDVVAWALERAG